MNLFQYLQAKPTHCKYTEGGCGVVSSSEGLIFSEIQRTFNWHAKVGCQKGEVIIEIREFYRKLSFMIPVKGGTGLTAN